MTRTRFPLFGEAGKADGPCNSLLTIVHADSLRQAQSAAVIMCKLPSQLSGKNGVGHPKLMMPSVPQPGPLVK